MMTDEQFIALLAWKMYQDYHSRGVQGSMQPQLTSFIPQAKSMLAAVKASA